MVIHVKKKTNPFNPCDPWFFLRCAVRLLALASVASVVVGVVRSLFVFIGAHVLRQAQHKLSKLGVQHPVNTLFALRDAERSLHPLVIGKKGLHRRTIGKDKEAKQSERDGGE